MPHHGEAVGGGGGGATHYFRYIHLLQSKHAAGNNNVTAARVYLQMIQIPVEMTIDRIAHCVVVQNGNIIRGIYEDNGLTPAGGALVVESASVALGAAGWDEITVADTTLAEGLYWLALESDDATANLRRVDSLSVPTISGHYFYNRALGYGPLTDPCPAILGPDAYCWMGYLRVASVP